MFAMMLVILPVIQPVTRLAILPATQLVIQHVSAEDRTNVLEKTKYKSIKLDRSIY